jgi:hypothetical protein
LAGDFDGDLGQSGMLRNGLSNFEDRMRFAGVKDDGLADPFVVYLFRPGQITQASVVIFLELSVTHFISHAEKYPSPILALAIPPFVTKKIDLAGLRKECAEAVGSRCLPGPRGVER